MSQTPAGWYDDGRGALRYWDGVAWTQHVHQPAASAAPGVPTASAVPGVPGVPTASAPSTPAQRGGNVPAWVWWASGAFLLLLLVAVVTVTITTAMKPNYKNDARAAVEAYDSAWVNRDCAALWEVTTEDYRAQARLDDCAAFELAAGAAHQRYLDYYMWIDTVDVDGSTAKVVTWESFYEDDRYTDLNGTYRVVMRGEQWLVDSVTYSEPQYYD